MRFLTAHSPYLLSILRIVAGLLFAFHGTQKLFGFPQGKKVIGNVQLTIAGMIELVGGVLIALGLFVRPVAFIASGEMAVAYFQAHAARSFWPIVNQGELTILYCFLFLYVASVGAGPLALDSLFAR